MVLVLNLILSMLLAGSLAMAATPQQSCNPTNYCDCRVEGKGPSVCLAEAACEAGEVEEVEEKYELAVCDTSDPTCTEQHQFKICDKIIQSIEDPAYDPFMTNSNP